MASRESSGTGPPARSIPRSPRPGKPTTSAWSSSGTGPPSGPSSSGKLHVITGGMDTFYLEGAVQLLKDSLAKLKSDAVVEIVPGRDHGTILDAKLAQRIDGEMKAAVAQFLDAK